MIATAPQPEIVTAPWDLTGEGYILLYQFSPGFIASRGFIPPEILPDYQGGLSSVMLVNYQHSDAGPYQELLFIPGRFEHQGTGYFSISKIYVSTTASVLSGRRNWGIPKELADFEFGPVVENRQRVQVMQADQRIAAFDFQVFGPRLPVSTRLLPENLRTLLQHYHDQIYFTSPGGSGALRYTRLLDLQINPELFPDLTRGRLLTCVQATDFRLRFPEAQVESEPDHAN